MQPDFSVVIPAYNEMESLAALRRAIDEYSRSVEISLQFVFVDDGSSDGTFDELQSWDLPSAQVKLVKLSRNYGSHAAIRAGIYHSDADAVMIYSSDMPEPIEDITRYYEGLQLGNEFVYSIRRGYSGDFGSRVFAKLVNKFIDSGYPAEGLIGVAFGKKIKNELNANVESNSSIFFQIFQLGFDRLAIEVDYIERSQGESKWTFAKKIKLFIDSFVMFSYAPIRAISALGIAMASAGILWAIGIVVAKMFGLVDFAAGWPTMMSIMLVGFGVTNLSLGIIAEYLVRTLDAARDRRTFIVDKIVNLRQE